MSNPTTLRTDTLEIWRTNLNLLGANLGDPASLYSSDAGDSFSQPASFLLAINDLNTRKVKRSGDTITGALVLQTTLSVAGISTLGITTVTAPSADVFTGNRAITNNWFLGQVATTLPLAPATLGLIGASNKWAREDHVHPTDSSLATNTNPQFTGVLSLFSGVTGITDISVLTITTTTTALQNLASFSAATYRSAEFIIQAVDATGTKYHSVTIKAVHDGTLVNSVEYATAATANGVCGTFTVDVSGANLRLRVTPATTNSTVFRVTSILTKV